MMLSCDSYFCVFQVSKICLLKAMFGIFAVYLDVFTEFLSFFQNFKPVVKCCMEWNKRVTFNHKHWSKLLQQILKSFVSKRVCVALEIYKKWRKENGDHIHMLSLNHWFNTIRSCLHSSYQKRGCYKWLKHFPINWQIYKCWKSIKLLSKT